MDISIISEMRQEAHRLYQAQKARKRAHYRLARELGFSSAEAQLLAGRSEEHIRNLAEQAREAEKTG